MIDLDLKNKVENLKRRYKSIKKDHLARDFYAPCLLASKKLKRATCDFTSSVLYQYGNALPNNKVIGVRRIHEDKNKKAQIRFMAVHSKYRNNNVGEKILKELEQYAYKNSIDHIYLNARDSAVKFYLKNGYKIIKKSHVLFGNIHHWLMEKNIIK